jgi:non-heme chloroperoxidase
LNVGRSSPNGPTIWTTSSDGTRLAVQEWGNPRGAELLLLHGLLGSRLTWQFQTDSPVLKNFRIVSYDLRGHGMSDKPATAAAYTDGKRWAADFVAVMEATCLKRPVVVVWSMGAQIITNYLQVHGDSQLAGIVFVDPVTEPKRNLLVPRPETREKLMSSNSAVHLAGTREFVRLCFVRPPESGILDKLVNAANMASPVMVGAVPSMTNPAATALPAVKVPVLIIFGEQDALVMPAMVTRTRQLIPHAQVSLYEGIGHAPFMEDPERFNREVDQFIEEVFFRVNK